MGKVWRSTGDSRGSRLPGRRPRRVAAVIAMAAGLGLILTAAPAFAASASFSSPNAGSTYDGVSANQTSVSLAATESYNVGESGTVTLYVSDPRYAQNHADGCQWSFSPVKYGDLLGGSASVSGTVNLTTKTYPSSCTNTTSGSSTYAGQLPVNGKWTATVEDTESPPTTRTFMVAIKPAAPTGLSGTSPGPLQETIGWVRNPELDTHLYEVLDGSGNSLGSYPASQACDSMTCHATVTASGAGSQSFQVEAFRRSAPTSDVNDPSTTGDLTATSATATFTVQAGSAASPPSPAAGSGTVGGGSSGTGSGGTGSTGTGSGGAGSSGTGSGGTGSTGSGGTGSSSAGKVTPTGTASAKPAAKPGHAAAPVAPKAPSAGAPMLGHTVSKGQAAKLGAIFENFAPSAGIDKLPPLPVLASSAPGVPVADPADGEPTDQGTFKLKLGYTPQSTTTAVTTTTVPLSSVADALGVSPVGLWRSVAGSLLLLLGAAHVRRFAKAPID